MTTPRQDGWYPEQPYYAPGWEAPAGAEPPRGRGTRPSRVVLWVVVGVLGLLALTTAGLAVARQVQLRPLGDVTGPTTAHTRQLAVGHCVAELPDDGDVARVRVVPCDEPHEAEVVGVHVLDDGDWPGDAAVRREVAASCEMDVAQQEAGAQAVVWAPSAQSWGQGDRHGLCLAWHPDGPVTGTWRDATVTPVP